LSVLALASGSLIARALGPFGRGELAAIQTWPALISLLAILGLSDAVVFFASRQRDKTAEYLVSAVVLLLVSAVPFVAIGYILTPIFLAAQSPGIITATRWYLAVFVPLQATQGMLLHPLRAQRDFVPWNLLRILVGASWFLISMVAMIYRIASPTRIAASFLVMLLLTAVPTLLVLLRRVPGPYRLNWRTWRPMLAFGLPSAASAIPQVLNLRLDQIAMAALMSPDRLGYYVVAVAWSGALAPLLNSVGAVLFPRVAMETSLPAQTKALARGTRLTVTLALVMSVPLMAITPTAIVLLFGRDFSAAIPAALILILAGAVLSLDSVLEEGLRGLGFTRAIFWGESGGVVVTVIALGLTLSPLGIVGAALSSLLGYSVTASLLLFQLWRITGCSLALFLLPRSTDFQLARQQLVNVIGRE
jgi:O-antigen/teichoic acid export membrane protein